ncbi:MAG TPA: hypothetical protein VN203_09980, partial [Candidatus Acidoferrum sp.]|nr:hypothetical protein [Candidatus Acidoferrum sp.]
YLRTEPWLYDLTWMVEVYQADGDFYRVDPSTDRIVEIVPVSDASFLGEVPTQANTQAQEKQAVEIIGKLASDIDLGSLTVAENGSPGYYRWENRSANRLGSGEFPIVQVVFAPDGRFFSYTNTLRHPVSQNRVEAAIRNFGQPVNGGIVRQGTTLLDPSLPELKLDVYRVGGAEYDIDPKSSQIRRYQIAPDEPVDGKVLSLEELKQMAVQFVVVQQVPELQSGGYQFEQGDKSGQNFFFRWSKGPQGDPGYLLHVQVSYTRFGQLFFFENTLPAGSETSQPPTPSPVPQETQALDLNSSHEAIRTRILNPAWNTLWIEGQYTCRGQDNQAGNCFTQAWLARDGRGRVLTSYTVPSNFGFNLDVAVRQAAISDGQKQTRYDLQTRQEIQPGIVSPYNLHPLEAVNEVTRMLFPAFLAVHSQDVQPLK